MLYNYLKIALRNLRKNTTFSIINALGLALGMACFFMMLLYVVNEFSYDQFHEKGDRIYRMNYHADFAGEGMVIARVPPPIAPLMHQNFPEVEQVARMFPRNVSISYKDKEGSVNERFEVENFFFADSTVLDIFTFEFLSGNPKTALNSPNGIIITEEMSKQFFGNDPALGKTIHLLNEHPVEITGVVKSFPQNSHLEFNMITPYENMFRIAPESSRTNMRNNLNSNWVISHSMTYVLLQEGANPEAVNTAFPEFLQKFGNPQVRDNQRFLLAPIAEIHVGDPSIGMEPTPVVNLTYLYILLAIGFITLLIACINFINFSTASSLNRAREVGVRKVLGAEKGNIVWQFLGESMLISFIGFLFAILLMRMGLPYLNALMDSELSFSLVDNWQLSLLFLGIFLLVGFLAGSYPAFFVTRFKPISILSGKGFSNIPKGQALRKVLITVQFIASIGLIAGTLGIYKQLEYLRNQPVGFDKEHVVTVPLFSTSLNSIFGGVDGDLRQKTNSFEESLLANPNVKSVTLSDRAPGFGAVRRNVTAEKITAEDNLFLGSNSVDYDFIESYGLEIIAGRSFSKEFGTDHTNAYVINEQAVESLRWESPEDALGKPLNQEGKAGTVVGVVKDFHFTGLQSIINPLIMHIDVGVFTTFSIKVNSSGVPETLRFIEDQWNEFFPQKVFEHTFLDDSITAFYSAEDQLARMIGYLAFLAILISCFGLYGLVAFAAVQKSKEIGIRKVLGASIPNILTLLSKEFFILILVAGVIALPIAYYGLVQWLEAYPYAVNLGWSLFVLPLLAVVAIALLTISYQTMRAAVANPVEALRDE